MEWVKQNASEGWNYEDVKMSDKSKTFEVFFPKECDLDKINRITIRGREFIEVVHGEWIKMSDADGYYYCCSVCGEELPRYMTESPSWDKPYPHKHSIDKTNFCPTCGAKMDGKERNDESIR